MTLRREYSLGHSEYNDFLFASVGEEKIGMPLTVLTALTRLGQDPWLEAARLADLSKEAAQLAFTATIARLPEGDWKVADAGAIAARLLKWLPGKSAKAVPPPARVVPRSVGERMKLVIAPWMVWAALVVAILLVTVYLQADHNLEPAARGGGTTQQ
ncbi:MAG: hypothetical protein ACXWLB_03855 [Reyranella sp.]